MPASSRSEVFVGYLDYFRARVIDKVGQLGDHEQRSSRLQSGWTPLELVKHLGFVELRWLEWGFAGRNVTDPWGDHRDGRWYVSPDETADQLLSALRAQGERSRAIIETNDLNTVGQPGPRRDGADDIPRHVGRPGRRPSGRGWRDARRADDARRVPGLIWPGWPESTGTGGRNAPDWVAGFGRIGWPVSAGLPS